MIYKRLLFDDRLTAFWHHCGIWRAPLVAALEKRHDPVVIFKEQMSCF